MKAIFFVFSQISTNVPYLTSVIATLRVTIPTGHTSAPVTAATLEMDVHVKVPSDLELLAQFLRDSNKNMRHLEIVGSNANGSKLLDSSNNKYSFSGKSKCLKRLT